MRRLIDHFCRSLLESPMIFTFIPLVARRLQTLLFCISAYTTERESRNPFNKALNKKIGTLKKVLTTKTYSRNSLNKETKENNS